jgi:acyl-CoA thioester hydrolase
MMHRLSIRVRYAESDQMGYAHHAAYVVWLEEARIEWLRSIGESYRDLEAKGVLMPVVECRLRYRRPLRFDDQVDLETSIASSGPSRVTFTTVLTHQGQPCAEGQVTVATVNRDGRPMRLPAGLLAALSNG